jgi:hypothetical protein
VNKSTRYAALHEMAHRQLSRLNAIDAEKGFRKLEPSIKMLNPTIQS